MKLPGQWSCPRCFFRVSSLAEKFGGAVLCGTPSPKMSTWHPSCKNLSRNKNLEIDAKLGSLKGLLTLGVFCSGFYCFHRIFLLAWLLILWLWGKFSFNYLLKIIIIIYLVNHLGKLKFRKVRYINLMKNKWPWKMHAGLFLFVVLENTY